MRDFLAAIWGDLGDRYGELRSFPVLIGKPIQTWHETVEGAEASALVLSLSHDVYFGVLPRLGKKGGGDAIADETTLLWADFDGKAFNADLDEGKPQAFAALSSIPLEPQIVVDSGNGYHGYWLLGETVPFDEARQVMKGFQVVAGADKTYDKARILRVPGTLNHKTNPPKPVRILRFNLLARKHRISDFVDYASAAMPARPERDWTRELSMGEPLNITGWDPSRPGVAPFPEGTRNNSLAALAGIMFARGMDQPAVELALHHENLVRCDPPLDEDEVDRIVESIGRLHGG